MGIEMRMKVSDLVIAGVYAFCPGTGHSLIREWKTNEELGLISDFFIFILSKVLLQNANPTQAEELQSGYRMLTSKSEMGEKFKLFSLVQHGLPQPAAFAL